MRNIVLFLLKLYQNTLSPDHGPLKHLYPYGYCRHEPTCSEYAKQQVHTRGVLVGLAMAYWRLLHCTPWTKPSEKRVLSQLARE